MDDPWGSPWATDAPRLDLPAPPPLVHTPRVPNKATSPWGGGGAGHEEEENPWGNINGAAYGGGGSESPGWNRSPGKSPSLRPVRSGTVSRQPSWASFGQRSEDLEVARPIASLGSLNGDSARSSHDVTAGNGYLTPSSESKANQIDERRPDDENQHNVLTTKSNDTATETIPIEEVEDHGTPPGSPRPAVQSGIRPEPARQVSKVQELVEMYDGIEKKRDEPNEGPLAGPRIKLVGSPADDTGEVLDSLKNARTAKESGFDAAEGPVAMRNEGPKEIATGTMIEKDSADQAEDDDSIPDESLVDDHNEISGEVIIEETREVQPALPGHEHDPAPATVGTIPETLKDNSFTSIQPPSIPFSVDMSQIDFLFPSTAPSTIDPEPVPDVIIDDTFASISERKMWYRISRPGPMRQHNLGNDENYVRLDWRSSEIKNGCLKIVRRWMEEDSIAGRVGVGRRMKGMGIGGAGMFGWNSTEPEVGIGELLSKNRSHARGPSVVSQETKSAEPSPTISTFSLTSPTGLSFGWEDPPTSRFPADVTASKREDASKRSSWIAPQTTEISEAPTRNSWIAPPPAVSSSKERAVGQTAMAIDAVVANEWASPAGDIGTNGSTGDDGSDNDDWGEMVTSPPLPAEPMANATMVEDTRGSSSTTDLDKAVPGSAFSTAAINDEFTDFESAWGPAEPKAALTNSESAQGLLGVEDQPDAIDHSTESWEGPTAKSSMLGQPPHEGFEITSVLADVPIEAPEGEECESLSSQAAKIETAVDHDQLHVDATPTTTKEHSHATPVVKSPVSTLMPLASSAPKTRRILSGEEESAAQQILLNLPDLSYMLR